MIVIYYDIEVRKMNQIEKLKSKDPQCKLSDLDRTYAEAGYRLLVENL